MSFFRRILVAVGALILIALIALIALPFLVDANRLHPLVQAQLEQRLHRAVTLGDMQLKTFPLAVRISRVIVGQPDSFKSAQPMLQAEEVYVGVALWPLIHRQINIDAIRLRSPRFEIVRNPAGAWNYGSGSATTSGGSFGGITLDELRVDNGQIAIHDQTASTRDVYKHINLTLKGLGPNRRGSVLGDVRLDTMAAVLNIRADFENRDGFTAKGTLRLKSDANNDALDIVSELRRDSSHGPLTIESLTAKMGALSLSAIGAVGMEQTPVTLDLRVHTDKAPIADLLRIAALYGAKFPPGLKAEGMLSANVHVAGTITKPVLDGKIDATKAEIRAKELAEPVRTSELHIDFTPDSLSTGRFTVETGGTRLIAQGTVSKYTTSSPNIHATLETNGAHVEELLRIARAYGIKPAGLAGSGAVTLKVEISRVGKAVNYSGAGSIRDVSLTSPRIPKTVTIAAADVNFSEDRVSADHLQAVLGSMHIKGTGSVRDFAHPEVWFDLHADQVNSAELRDWSSGSTKQSGNQQPSDLGNIKAIGTLMIDKLVYDHITFSNVKTTVNLVKGILKLDPITSVVFNGQQSGSIIADLGDDTPAYNIKSKLVNVDTNQLLTATTSLKQLLSGSLSGNVDVQSHARPNEDIAKSLNGRVQFQMIQGRLSGVHVLNEIANVGRFFGYSKKPQSFTDIAKLAGSLDIQNGVASTNDLFMDLGGATLSGAGNIGLADQSLKLRVTSVLGKDFAQQNVPGQIGGWLTTVLANQRGELIVPAIVTGALSQPKFAPDLEMMGQLKLRGLLPTGKNPAAFTSGIKGIVETVTGKSRDATTDESKPPSLLDVLKDLGKKKDEKKP